MSTVPLSAELKIPKKKPEVFMVFTYVENIGFDPRGSLSIANINELTQTLMS